MQRGSIIDNMTELSNSKELSKLSLNEVQEYEKKIKEDLKNSEKFLMELKLEHQQRERLVRSCDIIISKKISQSSFELFKVGESIELETWRGYVSTLNCRTNKLEISKINKSSIWVKFDGYIGDRGYDDDPSTPLTSNEEKLNISQFRDILKYHAKDKKLYSRMEEILTRDSKLDSLFD